MSISNAASAVHHPIGMLSQELYSSLDCIAKYVPPVLKGRSSYRSETTENKPVNEININDKYNLGFMMTVFNNMYKLRKANEIRAFLSDNDYLIPLVSDAYSHLQKYFPGSTVFMEVERGDLLISVRTNLSPENAIKELDKFDDEWWLDACIDSRAKLCIMVEYQ